MIARVHVLRVLIAGAAGAGAELCGIALIASAAWLIVRAAQHPPLSALALAIVAVRACAMLRGGLRYAERLAGHDAALRALATVRTHVYAGLRRRSVTRSPGCSPREADLTVRMVADVEAVQDLLLRCLLPAVVAATVTVTAIALTTTLLPAAGAVLAVGLLIAGAGLPALAALTTQHHTDARVDLAVRSLDVIRGAADLAAFGATARAVAQAENAATRLARRERRAGAVDALIEALGMAAQGLTALGVIWTAIHRDADDVLVAVLALTSLVATEAVLPVAGAARRLTELLPSVRRVTDILDDDRSSGPSGVSRRAMITGAGPPNDTAEIVHKVPPPSRPPHLELVRARVSYGAAVALDDVDLRITPGRRIALVGASGAGKSTLLGVLSGQIAPDSGTVLLSDLDMRAYDPGDVCAIVRGLFQDAYVFTASIRANIALAKPEAGTDELDAAARRAGLLDWIESLPEGWETTVDSTRLSGGQRQRMLLARALLADPPVLMLDEPAEALDIATADALVADLLGDRSDRTVVMVTHRLAPLATADEVIVLDQGRIVQHGTHTALIVRPGPYRDLWEAEQLTRAE